MYVYVITCMCYIYELLNQFIWIFHIFNGQAVFHVRVIII